MSSSYAGTSCSFRGSKKDYHAFNEETDSENTGVISPFTQFSSGLKSDSSKHQVDAFPGISALPDLKKVPHITNAPKEKDPFAFGDFLGGKQTLASDLLMKTPSYQKEHSDSSRFFGNQNSIAPEIDKKKLSYTAAAHSHDAQEASQKQDGSKNKAILGRYDAETFTHDREIRSRGSVVSGNYNESKASQKFLQRQINDTSSSAKSVDHHKRLQVSGKEKAADFISQAARKLGLGARPTASLERNQITSGKQFTAPLPEEKPKTEHTQQPLDETHFKQMLRGLDKELESPTKTGASKWEKLFYRRLGLEPSGYQPPADLSREAVRQIRELTPEQEEARYRATRPSYETWKKELDLREKISQEEWALQREKDRKGEVWMNTHPKFSLEYSGRNGGLFVNAMKDWKHM